MPTCPVAGCSKQIRSEKLMCARHWFQLPVYLRRKVTEAYLAYQTGDVDLVSLRDVQGAAIRSIEAKGR